MRDQSTSANGVFASDLFRLTLSVLVVLTGL